MLAPVKRRANEELSASSFKKKLLRQTFTIALGIGVSTVAMSSNVSAQFSAGDVPASPWSSRPEPLYAFSKDVGSQPQSKRLRQPNSAVATNSPYESRTAEPQANRSSRPAPVTLMGPMLPTSRPQEQASPQANTRPPERPSPASFGRLQEFQKETKIAVPQGLPDRIEPPSNNLFQSQMASTRFTLELQEPIQLRATPGQQQSDAAESEAKPRGISISPRLPSTSIMKPSEPIGSVQLDLAPRHPKPENRNPQKVVEQSDNARIDFPALEPELDRSVKVEQRKDETQMRRIALAERVSHQLLSGSPADYALAPEALESLPGWQSVERELRERLDRCDTLLKRGAVLSAREEASEGLLRLYRTMDLHRGKLFSESLFQKATTALREELDFQKTVGSRHNSAVQSIVNTHSTAALKNRPLESTALDMAAMHYRWYARYQLVAASDGHPWAADLLYAYGKTIEKEADLNPSKANQFRSQAVVFYQAATQVKPTHSEAASQLGFALIHLDRLEDAYAALGDSLKHKPTANAWNNLAEVFRRRGANSEADFAVQQAGILAQSTPQYSAENPEIIAVDPIVFARYSPIPTMAYPSQNIAPGNQTVSPSANDRSATSGNRFLSKIFR